MLYLVNRHTGRNIEWNVAADTKQLPSRDFFRQSDFAKTGHIVELVSISLVEEEYFGIRWRKDSFKVLARARLDEFGISVFSSE